MGAYSEIIDMEVRLSTLKAMKDLDVFKDEMKRSFNNIMGSPVEFEDKNSDRKQNVNNNARSSQQAAAKNEAAFKKARTQFTAFGLSVLFFGNQLQKAATSFLKPAADAVGIMDIWNAALTLLFLPIMLLILPLFLAFLDAVSQMPDELKLIIGGIVLLAGVIGFLLSSFGSVILLGVGIASLLGPLGIGALAAALGGAGAGLVGACALAVAALGPLAIAIAGIALLASMAPQNTEAQNKNIASFNPLGGLPIVGPATTWLAQQLGDVANGGRDLLFGAGTSAKFGLANPSNTTNNTSTSTSTNFSNIFNGGMGGSPTPTSEQINRVRTTAAVTGGLGN